MSARIPNCKLHDHWPDDWGISSEDCNNCSDYHSKSRPTYGDLLRQMADNDLAEVMYKTENKSGFIFNFEDGTTEHFCPITKEEWLKFLKTEIKKEDNKT